MNAASGCARKDPLVITFLNEEGWTEAVGVDLPKLPCGFLAKMCKDGRSFDLFKRSRIVAAALGPSVDYKLSTRLYVDIVGIAQQYPCKFCTLNKSTLSDVCVVLAEYMLPGELLMNAEKAGFAMAKGEIALTVRSRRGNPSSFE